MPLIRKDHGLKYRLEVARFIISASRAASLTWADGGKGFKGEHNDYSTSAEVITTWETAASPANSDKRVYRSQSKLLIISEQLYNLGRRLEPFELRSEANGY